MKIDLDYIKAELLADIRVFKAPVLAELILKKHSEELLTVCALNHHQLLSSRAMWVLSHCHDIDYTRIEPYYEKLINHLNTKNLHNGVVRNILRLFQHESVPSSYETFLLDKCFNFIKNPTEAIAIRAFSITIVFNISKPYPELLSELSLLLNHILITENSPGIISRAKNILKEIRKITPL